MYPCHSCAMRADRLLAEIALLRTHGRMSAAAIARRLETSPRTVLRDMEALSAAGIPLYAERGRNGGFALLPGYRPPAEELSADEAQALFIAGGVGVADALGVGDAFARALRKLASGLPRGQAQGIGQAASRIVVDPTGWAGVLGHPELLSTVFEAVQADRQLIIDYRALSSGQGGRRTVDPWGVVLAGPSWYLVAAHRGRPHTYRVSRLVAAEMVDDSCRRPADLDLLAVWRRLREDYQARRPRQSVTLRVWAQRRDPVVQALGMVLQEPPEITGDGGSYDTIVAVVGSLRGTAGILLGYGSWVEVLDPPELRSMMAAVATEVVTLYS